MMRFFHYVTILLLLGIVLLYAGLIPAQQWHMDEYRTFLMFTQDTFSYFLQRMSWSPRPVSELLLFCYFWGVEHTHSPMISLMLGACWMTLIAALSIGLLRGLPVGKQPEVILSRLLLLLALCCMYLLAEPPAEVFFWTQGAVAYLITLSSITALLFYEATSSGYTTVLSCLLLVVCAGSCEMGAMFAASFSALQLLRYGYAKKGNSFFYTAHTLAFMVAAFLIMEVIHGRVGHIELLVPTHARLEWPISIRLGTLYFLRDLVHLLDFQIFSVGYIFFTLGATAMLWLGLALCLTGAGYQRSDALHSFILAALLTCLGSFIAAEYEFGGACCARHESLRQALILLSVTAASMRYDPFATFARIRSFAPFFLCLPILALTAIQLPALAHDWLHYREFTAAREQTWQSGNNPASTSMVFVNPPLAQVSEAFYLKPGIYNMHERRFSDDAISAAIIMQFFGKETLRATEPFP